MLNKQCIPNIYSIPILETVIQINAILNITYILKTTTILQTQLAYFNNTLDNKVMVATIQNGLKCRTRC